MDTQLYECIKVAAYFLWEYTKYDNALTLWRCAEDMAHYMQRIQVLDNKSIEDIKQAGKYHPTYINFVRHIAYRIYVYTGNDDALSNWFTSEKLLDNREWCQSMVNTAKIYNDNAD